MSAGKMKAGDLKHPVTLLKPVSETNNRNRRETEWVTAATVYAAKSDVSGREFWVAQAYNAEDIVTFTIRWRDDVDATWRLQHHDTVYNIVEVNHLGYMRDYIRLRCRVVNGGGS